MIHAFVYLAAAALAQVSNYPPAYPVAKQGGHYMHNFYIPPAPSTTPWAPAWSPDGKWIAVAMYGSIWRVDPASGEATELTYNRRYHSSPAFSPDGKWIAYTADDDGKNIQLEIVNVASGEIRTLTTGNQLYLDPAFSPDGKRLAYVSTQPSGAFNIYTRSIVNGDWAGQPTALTKDNKYARDRLYFGPSDFHMEPAWTPDGKELVFLSNRGVPLGSGHLWRMPADSGGMENARAILQEQTLYRTRPDVSVDGKRVLYSSTGGASDQYCNLYVTPIEGGAPYKLTFGNYDSFHPRWSPDGEWIAYVHNRDGLPQLALLETYGGKKRDVVIRKRVWKRPMGRLHVRVTDANGGAQLHARIHGPASDGKFYAPTDAYSRIGFNGEHVFHTKGDYTVEVPPGRMKIDAVHGFEYWPASREVTVEAAKTLPVQFALKRMTNSATQGWFSGSTHVHMNYAGNLHNTPENLILMSRAEQMDLIMNLVANKDNRILDHQFFAGAGEHPATRAMSDVKLHMGEEYRPPFYGHVFFLGLKDHLISPFTTGYEGTGIESLYPSNTDMFRKARAQGALNGYVHAFYGDADPLAAQLGGAKSFPVDAALGTVECLEWSGATRAQLRVWHHALNNDLAVAPTGGEDSISNLHRIKLVGSVRTYVQSGKLAVGDWIEALRKGRSYFTTGPLLSFRVNGKGPGERVQLAAAGGQIVLEAEVKSITPLSKVVIHRNGAVFRELTLTSGKLSASLKETVPAGGSAWYSLYAEGPPNRLLDSEYPQAATNAVRVYVGDQKIRSKESARYFQNWIDKLETMANEWPWWRSEKERKHVTGQFEEARKVYRKLEQEAN
ncbi:MAG: CehA/McbA family metallohydrolase [Candidatus Solibacter usitatus]|nr:CehA/McbA family metallohydrolase [Candidatus Solibacter usitatus]